MPSISDFKKYADKYKKPYTKDIEVNQTTPPFIKTIKAIEKFDKFEKNIVKMEKINKSPKPPYVAEINSLCDLSEVEFKGMLGLTSGPSAPSAPSAPSVPSVLGNTPSQEVDWRTKKNFKGEDVLTPVKEQLCETCWAYTAAEEVESAWILAGGPSNIRLSAQYVAHCSHYGDCFDGGWLEPGIQLAQRLQGLPTEDDYNLECLSDPPCGTPVCTPSPSIFRTGPINWNWLADGEEAIIEALQSGPVIVGIAANTWQFFGETSVMITNCEVSSTNPINHSIQVVGWKPARGNVVAHFIFRNSWGVGWGDDGYGYLASGNNTCGMGRANFNGRTSIQLQALLSPTPAPGPGPGSRVFTSVQSPATSSTLPVKLIIIITVISVVIAAASVSLGFFTLPFLGGITTSRFTIPKNIVLR